MELSPRLQGTDGGLGRVQVHSDTGRDASQPSLRINSAQQTRQQAQSVQHPIGYSLPAIKPGYPQGGAAVPAVPHAQQAQHQQQEQRAAAQELLALSRQQGCQLGASAGQAGQAEPVVRDPTGLTLHVRAGSGHFGAAPQTPTALSPRFAAGQIGHPAPDQILRAGSGPLMRAASDQLRRMGSGPFTPTGPVHAGPGQLLQGYRALSGQVAEAALPGPCQLSRASSGAAAEAMGGGQPSLQLQDIQAAQLQEGSRTFPYAGLAPRALASNVAMQQAQQQQQQGQQAQQQQQSGTMPLSPVLPSETCLQPTLKRLACPLCPAETPRAPFPLHHLRLVPSCILCTPQHDAWAQGRMPDVRCACHSGCLVRGVPAPHECAAACQHVPLRRGVALELPLRAVPDGRPGNERCRHGHPQWARYGGSFENLYPCLAVWQSLQRV